MEHSFLRSDFNNRNFSVVLDVSFNVASCVSDFEAAVRDKTGFQFAVATSSCTAALHLALRVLGVRPGDEVWCPTLTFIASIGPAVKLGAVPRFIDVDPLTWTLSPEFIGQELKHAAARGRLPKVVISTDLYGIPADVLKLKEVCAAYNIPLVSDSAASLGSRLRGFHAGYGATVACISFNLNKIVSTFGGGMLLTDSEQLADRARKIARQSREPCLSYLHKSVGFNFAMSPACAAIGLQKICYLDELVEKRRRIFRQYVDLLSDHSDISFQYETLGATSNRWLTTFIFGDSFKNICIESICYELAELGIDARPVWRPLHLQPMFQGALVSGGHVAEKVCRRGICLPSGSALEMWEQEMIIGRLFRALRRWQ